MLAPKGYKRDNIIVPMRAFRDKKPGPFTWRDYMAVSRKDNKGRALRKGECQRKQDLRYVYSYTDPLGRRKYVYDTDLQRLREREKKLLRDQLDGLDIYAAGRSTLNQAFDRYMATKYKLKDSTMSGYQYTYDRYVRDGFGQKKLIDIKCSDVMQFYIYLLQERDLSVATVDSVHCLLHPTFELAVRDDIIRKNPTHGVMREVTKRVDDDKELRFALKVDEQRAFMDYVASHPIFYHWWPLFTVLLGTGMRIGECTGITWKDIDYENNEISVNHNLVYYPERESRVSEYHIHTPKTKAGIRTIPLLDVVKDALEMEREDQLETVGLNQTEIDGVSGFVFQNRYGDVLNPQSVNKTISRIVESYNHEEMLNAARENREPFLLPHITCHIFRYTFATRLCEAEDNLKVIQSVMGHKSIETTMNIYAQATGRKNQESFLKLASKLDNLF